jgi:hypothetical protein
MTETESTGGQWSPCYRVSVKSEIDNDIVTVGPVVGAVMPVCLTLSLWKYDALTRAETITDAGVVLIIDMSQEKHYGYIWKSEILQNNTVGFFRLHNSELCKRKDSVTDQHVSVCKIYDRK